MELKKYKLGDCVEILDNIRVPLSSNQRTSLKKIYPYYGAQGIIDYVDNYLFDGDYVLVAEDGNNLKSRNEPIALWASGKFWVNNHAHILGAKEGFNLRYLFYAINQTDIKGYVSGSAQPKLNQDNLKKIEIVLPPFPYQRKIASVLSSLDRKIALNRVINQNLEALAKQLYDYWFVQFDFPDENGKPYKSSGGKMVWNEKLKREIPEGWEVVNYKELFTIGNGKTIPQIDGLIPAYGGNGVVKNVGESNYDSCIIIGRVGANCGSIHYSKVPCWVSDNAIAVCPIIDSWLPYLYYSLKLFNLAKGKGGSSQPLITHMSLKELYFPISKRVVEKYVSIANNLQDMIYSSQIEIQQLTKQRDELLPLLMNGQVTVE